MAILSKSMVAIVSASIAIVVVTLQSQTNLNRFENSAGRSESKMLVPGIQEDEKQQGKQEDEDKLVLPAHDPDRAARLDFMRTKLMYSQNIFEGLTIGDFDAIDTAIAEVQMVTEGEQWIAIDNEVYQRLTDEFKASTRRLKRTAETRNIEATAFRFYDMSTRCIDCHQHIRKAGYSL